MYKRMSKMCSDSSCALTAQLVAASEDLLIGFFDGNCKNRSLGLMVNIEGNYGHLKFEVSNGVTFGPT